MPRRKPRAIADGRPGAVSVGASAPVQAASLAGSRLEYDRKPKSSARLVAEVQRGGEAQFPGAVTGRSNASGNVALLISHHSTCRHLISTRTFLKN